MQGPSWSAGWRRWVSMALMAMLLAIAIPPVFAMWLPRICVRWPKKHASNNPTSE